MILEMRLKMGPHQQQREQGHVWFPDVVLRNSRPFRRSRGEHRLTRLSVFARLKDDRRLHFTRSASGVKSARCVLNSGVRGRRGLSTAASETVV